MVPSKTMGKSQPALSSGWGTGFSELKKKQKKMGISAFGKQSSEFSHLGAEPPPFLPRRIGDTPK